MNPTLDRLFGAGHAFDHPVTVAATIAIAALLILPVPLAWLLHRLGRLSAKTFADIRSRWFSWLILAPLMLVPILLGAAWVIAAVCLLSLLCYQEFARTTGLFREKTISLIVVLGILLLTFAVLDNYARLFFACSSLIVGLIAISTIPQDRPKGYIQRTALGVMGFLLFGYCLGYVAFFANDPGYRPVLIWLLIGVEINDVFAFCCGKLIGGPKCLPNTSPNKTWAGCLGALVLTTVCVGGLAHFVFAGTAVDNLGCLFILGVGFSILGQLGDLLVSSIKRDVGIKDIGHTFPGMGGLLDRFDSLVLVPPAAYHFLSLMLGPLDERSAQRILTGGGSG
jgi:phosphatidate cytidylyltransferase